MFGEFGIGNLGNEATLSEALRRVRVTMPQAAVKVLCYDAERTLTAHNGEHPLLSTGSVLKSERSEGRASHLLPARLGRLFSRFGDMGRTFRGTRGAAVVIIPGTGILEELWVGTWGVPALLLALVVGAWIHHAPVAIVSVGVDVPRTFLTAKFFSVVVRRASLRTFRDKHSVDAAQTLLGGRWRAGRAPRLTPDIVLGAPITAVLTTPERPCLALGVMRYYGASDSFDEGATIHATYVDAISTFARGVLARGWDLRIFGGDDGDLPVARDIEARLTRWLSTQAIDPAPSIAIVEARSMAEVDDLIGSSTAVVATRYHNVVSAIRLNKPVISVSYGTKGHSLMQQAGMGRYCQWIEGLDATLLDKQFQQVVDEAAAIEATLADHLETFKAQSAAVWQDVAALSPALHHGEPPTVAGLPARSGRSEGKKNS